MLFLIVYVGAISVLFLFSVILFNLKEVVRTKTTNFVFQNIFNYILIYLIFLVIFKYFIDESPQEFIPTIINTIYDFTKIKSDSL